MERYNLKIFNYLLFFIPLIGVGQIVSLNSQLYFMDSSTNELHKGIAVRYAAESIHIYNGEKHIKVEKKTGTAIFSLYTEFFFDGGGNKFPWVYQKGYSDKEKDIFDSPNGDRFIFFHDSKDLWHLTDYISEKDTYKYIRVFDDMQNFVWMDSNESEAKETSKPLSEYFTKPEPVSDDSKTYRAIDSPFEDYIQRKINKIIDETGLGSEYKEGRTVYVVDLNSDSAPDIMILYTLENVSGGMNYTRNLIFVKNGEPYFNSDYDTTLYDKYSDPGEFLGFKNGLAVFKFTDRYEDNGEYTLLGFGISENQITSEVIILD